jgi:predicted GIY-YIG superfamily endonuclease
MGNPKYIGISCDLNRRVKEHFRNGNIPEGCVVQIMQTTASMNEIRNHEREKIRQHNPSLNKRNGGGGRNPY